MKVQSITIQTDAGVTTEVVPARVVAEMLGTSKNTITALLRRKGIAQFTLPGYGKKYFIRKADLEFALRLKIHPSPPDTSPKARRIIFKTDGRA